MTNGVHICAIHFLFSSDINYSVSQPMAYLIIDQLSCTGRVVLTMTENT